MRSLISITIVLISVAAGLACTSSEPQQDPAAAEQRGERQPLPEPPRIVGNDGPEQATFVARALPAVVTHSNLPIRETNTDPQDFLDYLTVDDGPYGFRAVLGIFSTTDHIDFDMIGLELVCDSQIEGGMLWIYAAAFPSYDARQRNIAAGLDDEGMPASVTFTRSADDSDVRLLFDTVEHHSAQLFDATLFLAVAKGYETAFVRLPFAGDYISAKIDLRGAFSTPIRPNLDWCGAY